MQGAGKLTLIAVGLWLLLQWRGLCLTQDLASLKEGRYWNNILKYWKLICDLACLRGVCTESTVWSKMQLLGGGVCLFLLLCSVLPEKGGEKRGRGGRGV